jgi:hypothetical protein
MNARPTRVLKRAFGTWADRRTPRIISIRERRQSVVAPFVRPIVVVAIVVPPPPPPMMLAVRPTIVIIVIAPVVGTVVVAMVIPTPVIAVVVVALPSQDRQRVPASAPTVANAKMLLRMWRSLPHLVLFRGMIPARDLVHWTVRACRNLSRQLNDS